MKAINLLLIAAVLILSGCEGSSGGGGSGGSESTTYMTEPGPEPDPKAQDPPAAPSDVHAEIIECLHKPSAGSRYEILIELSWVDNSDNEDGFEVRYFYHDDPNDYYANADADATSINIAVELHSVIPRYVKFKYIYAYNDAGESDYIAPDNIEFDTFQAIDYCDLYPPT